MKIAKSICDRQSEDRIDWHAFIVNLTFDLVLSAVQGFAFDINVSEVYVGVTTCPWWRFKGCAGYDGNGDSRPHSERFQRMWPILINRFGCVQVMEENVIAMLRGPDAAPKVCNAAKYVAGPCRSKVLFLYIGLSYKDETEAFRLVHLP